MLCDKVLDDFLSKELLAAQAIDKDYAELHTTIREYVAGGGKRIRPYLTVLAYQGYGGDDITTATHVACAWELLHAALLVHDDIIDRDVIRHGKPNITGMYQQIYSTLTDESVDHYALSAALLAGDLLITASQNIILRSSLSADQKIQILQYLNTAIFKVGGGELLDTETALRSISQTNPRLIAQYKTSSYSFISPLQSGAFLAGADADQLEQIHFLGDKIGVAFQLIDDLLGVFGDEKQTGKSSDGDIRERKHTLLLQETFTRASTSDRKKLTDYYSISTNLSNKDISYIRSLMISTGAKEAIAKEAAQLASEAKEAIAQLQMTDDAKNAMYDIVEVILKRQN